MKALPVVLTALVTVALVGCSSTEPAPAPAPSTPSAPTEAPAEPGPVVAAGDFDTLAFFAPDRVHIGVAVAGGGHHMEQSYPDPFSSDQPYRDQIAAEFTSLTPENQLKWEFVHPVRGQYNFEPADQIVEFAQNNGQVVRGHTLLWHSQNPGWLESGDFTAEELREILQDHITTVVGRYAGQIDQWDVANEIFDDQGRYRSENIWIRELGPEIVVDAFRWAHEADPSAQLFLNDYSVESVNAKSTAYYNLAVEMLDQGVPVHGFAVQGHLSSQYGFPGDLQTNLQRFADLGLLTAITEVDVRLPMGADGPSDRDLRLQADYYGQALAACLAVSTCTSFTLWGLTDTYSWVPHFFPSEGSATVTWEDYSRKASYCVMQAQLAQAAGLDGADEFAQRGCAAVE